MGTWGGGGEGLVAVDFLDEELCVAELVCVVVGGFAGSAGERLPAPVEARAGGVAL